MLEEGIYKCTILETYIVEQEGENPILEIYFDIAEGKNQGYYFEDLKSQIGNNPKWHGIKRYPLPINDGSDKDKRIRGLAVDVQRIIRETNPGITANIRSWIGATIYVQMQQYVTPQGELKPWTVAKKIVRRSMR